MANATIPSLPLAIALNGSEQIEIVQAGTSMRCTTAQIALLALTIGSSSGSAACTNRQWRSALAGLSAEVSVDDAVPADINDPVTIQWRNGSIVVQNDAVWDFTQSVTGYTDTQMLSLLASALAYPM